MILICKKSVPQFNDKLGNLFTKGSTYDFTPVNNKYTKLNNLIGYIKKDDEGFKRWIGKQFKKEFFALT